MTTEEKSYHQTVVEAVDAANPESKPEAPKVEAPPEEVVDPPQDTAQAAPEGEDEDAAASDGDDSTAPRKSKGVGKRINELTREKHEALRRAEAKEQEAAYWRDQAQKQQTPAFAESEKEPQLEDFGFDYVAHAKALGQWTARQEVNRVRNDWQQQQAQQQAAQVQQQFQARAKAIADKEPERWQQALTAPVPETPAFVEVIAHHEKGPELFVYLSEHLDEAHSIARQSPYLQAVQLGAIAERLKAAPSLRPVSLTKAPPVIPSVKAPASAVKSLEDQTIDDRRAAIRAAQARRS